MSEELKRRRKILWIPGIIILIGFLMWVGGAYLQISSPTKRDAQHTIPFNNHGTTHYLTPVVYYFPWVGYGLAGFGVASFLVLAWRIAKVLGISVEEVLGLKR